MGATPLPLTRTHTLAWTVRNSNNTQDFSGWLNLKMERKEDEKEKKQTVYLGERLFSFPSDRLGRLQDHTGKHREGDWDGLRRELSQNGYLLIRGLHSREEVLEARKVVLEHMAASGPGKLVGPTESGVLDARCGRGCVPFMEGRYSLTHS